jgi:hypothetical protein
MEAAVPAEKVVHHQKHQVRVEDDSPVPRRGLAMNRLRLVGTTRLRTNSLNFCTLIGPTETSTLRCM